MRLNKCNICSGSFLSHLLFHWPQWLATTHSHGSNLFVSSHLCCAVQESVSSVCDKPFWLRWMSMGWMAVWVLMQAVPTWVDRDGGGGMCSGLEQTCVSNTKGDMMRHPGQADAKCLWRFEPGQIGFEGGVRGLWLIRLMMVGISISTPAGVFWLIQAWGSFYGNIRIFMVSSRYKYGKQVELEKQSPTIFLKKSHYLFISFSHISLSPTH